MASTVVHIATTFTAFVVLCFFDLEPSGRLYLTLSVFGGGLGAAVVLWFWDYENRKLWAQDKGKVPEIEDPSLGSHYPFG